MFQGKSILGIIPARGGSKGVPRKNIKNIGKKPLIAWSIVEAQKSEYIDRLILSSEDEEIISVAKEYGCEVPFVRPPELAQDETLVVEVVRHVLEELPGFDYFVLLQPTSPLRRVEDIDHCIERCIRSYSDSSVSVTESEKSPYWMYSLEGSGMLTPVIKDVKKNNSRRQDLPKVYSLNGAVYVCRTDWFLKENVLLGEETLSYVMPKSRSIDIDTELDIKIVQLLLAEKKNGK